MTPSEVKFEIAHVLFIDIVGYSKLLITQQTERIEMLRGIMRGTEQFRAAEAEGKLLRLPSGDGGALVFRTTPEAPVLCGVEIARELKNHPELQVRMGIHSGPVNGSKAEQALRELEELAKTQYVSPTAFATIYLGLGEKEKCLDWLEKGYEQQDSACWYRKIDQIYDSVRGDLRFEALLTDIFGSTRCIPTHHWGRLTIS
jgi:hypothetical protein